MANSPHKNTNKNAVLTPPATTEESACDNDVAPLLLVSSGIIVVGLGVGGPYSKHESGPVVTLLQANPSSNSAEMDKPEHKTFSTISEQSKYD